jgi:hypothetical protein
VESMKSFSGDPYVPPERKVDRKKVLTQAEYGLKVNWWNKRKAAERLEEARTCAIAGHDWRYPPFGADGSTEVCIRCFKYVSYD